MPVLVNRNQNKAETPTRTNRLLENLSDFSDHSDPAVSRHTNRIEDSVPYG